MKAPKTFSRIIDRKRYDVQNATLVADDCYWDGQNFERNGTNTFLYKTGRGNFFVVCLTQWSGQRDILTPIALEEAMVLYEGPLSEHHVPYETAFPEVEVIDA